MSKVYIIATVNEKQEPVKTLWIGSNLETGEEKLKAYKEKYDSVCIFVK